MIAALLGTHPQPFTRAIALVTRLAGDEETFVQHGYTTPPVRHPPTMQFCSLLGCDALRDLLERCDLVVTHGGVGSIYMALAAAHRPIVIPRLQRFGEHIDDHQLEITERLARDGLVVACRLGDDITSARVGAGRAPAHRAGVALGRAVWAAAPLIRS